MNIAANITIDLPFEEMPRRAFSADDVRRMVEVGVLRESERIELVGGTLVEMASKGPLHDDFKDDLMMRLVRAAPEGVRVSVESTLQLSPSILLEPDIVAYPKRARRVTDEGFATVAGPDLLIVIEVAASSLAYDRGLKASLYASFGVRDYWIIDVGARRALVHRGPTGDGWSEVVEVGPSDLLTPLALELGSFAVRLADLD